MMTIVRNTKKDGLAVMTEDTGSGIITGVQAMLMFLTRNIGEFVQPAKKMTVNNNLLT